MVVLSCLGGQEQLLTSGLWEGLLSGNPLLELKVVCWPGVLDQCPHCSRRTNDGADRSEGVVEDGEQELKVWRCWVGGQGQRTS